MTTPAAQGRGAASLLYRNRGGDFPAWAGRDLAAAGVGVQALARDGATTADVLRRQLPEVTQAPVSVTVTMGGNDLIGAYGDSQASRAAIGRVSAIGRGGVALRPGGDPVADRGPVTVSADQGAGT
jgi:lysophospholipase L1-like esterase